MSDAAPSAQRLRCPACRAPFRGTRTCSRCGLDLGPPMLLVARAWLARNRARQALARGRAPEAAALAALADRICSTPAGRRLSLIARWMDADASGR